MTSFEREIASSLTSEPGLSAVKDLEHEFARAFAQAELYGARLDDRLRHVIHRVVDVAKASGKSADEIVAMIRDMARRGGFARPDAVRPVSSFPADRLLTKAITACIERYHDSEEEIPVIPPRSTSVTQIDPDDLAAIASGTDMRGAASARLRALLSHENEAAFVRAVALYVRSAPSRGLAFDEAVAGVNRILAALDDTVRPADDGSLRVRHLVMRGLLVALYDAHAVAEQGAAARDVSGTPAAAAYSPSADLTAQPH
jgi:hypothetical protein